MHKRRKRFDHGFSFQHKRVYTLTASQYIAGFIISVGFSMILGPLFERYAPRHLQTAAEAVTIISTLLKEEPIPLALHPTTIESPKNLPRPAPNSYDALREQLSALR